jgi:two-component system, chemotaxis family, sensor kinase CheA
LKDIRQRLLATFQVEHKEHLKFIRDILAKTNGTLTPPDLDEVFRRAHSLKGAARAVDLRPVEELAHGMETLFSRLRSGSMPFSIEMVEIVRRALDSSEDFLVALSEKQTPQPPTEVLEAINKLLKIQDTVDAKAPQPSIDSGSNTTPSFQPIETVRLITKNLDRLVSSAGELSTENLRQDLLGQKLRGITDQARTTLSERARLRKASSQAFRRVNSEAGLTAVTHYIEYLEHQSQLVYTHVRSTLELHDRNSWSLRSLTSELQREVRQARMMPAENAFETFPKMVRDLARDEGKTVQFQIIGAGVEADRMVLQTLKDPVMHILRNALSHGIESDAERKRKNKTAISRIEMKIEAHGNRLNIIVEDNGRGLDLTRIREVAVRQGLISATDAARQSPEELVGLVFLPGFSTSSSITEVSGRGMGLSVVSAAIVRLQGKVEILPISTGAGGTRVTISVPLSISSHRVLLVSSQNQTFAIPLHGIEKLCRIPLKEMETAEGKPVLTFNGRHIALVTLSRLLNTPEAAVRAEDETLNVAILKIGEKRLAVAVDAFLSEREAAIKELPLIAASNTKLAGGILLEDGSVCLVLNPAEIVGGFRHTGNSLVIKTAVVEAVPKSSRILIVDDSLTTRTLEKSILEAQGYKVSVAVDGVEALNCLQSEAVGLVVTDLEMPRMDGFALLIEMKRDPRLAKIPVIIVSSVENREQQEHGLALGADAYVVKRRFEQQELLETIEQIL